MYHVRKVPPRLCGQIVTRVLLSPSAHFRRCPQLSPSPPSAAVSIRILVAPLSTRTISGGAIDGTKVGAEQIAGAEGVKVHHSGPSDDGRSTASVSEKKTQPDENEGIFSRHGGKMVLGFIGGLVLWFLRNHLGSNALDVLKEEVEEACPFEPEEVEELRCANDYPPDTFRKVYDSARKAFPSGRATYPEFTRHVTSSGILPEPLFMGFLLDRVVLAAAAHPGFLGAVAREGSQALRQTEGLGDKALEDYGGAGLMGTDSRAAIELELDLGFLMVAFSAAVNTTPSERIRQLWELAKERSGGEGINGGIEVLLQQENSDDVIPASAAIEIVGMLMAAYQLPSGRYAVKDEKLTWPVQQYRHATGRDVFWKGLTALHEEQEKRTKGWIERKMAPRYDPAKEERVSLELFEKVLRARPVCAWGECLDGRRYKA